MGHTKHQKRKYTLTRRDHLAAWAVARMSILDTEEKEFVFGIFERAIKDIGTEYHSVLWWRENLKFCCQVFSITPDIVLTALGFAGYDLADIL